MGILLNNNPPHPPEAKGGIDYYLLPLIKGGWEGLGGLLFYHPLPQSRGGDDKETL